MDSLLLSLVQVSVHWASVQDWLPGDRIPTMEVGGYSLWLVQKGEIEVWSSDKEVWRIPAGRAALFPPHRRRSIATPQGAYWLSIGLSAHLFGPVDLLDTAPAPLIWEPTDEENERLTIWMRHMFEECVQTGIISEYRTSDNRRPIYMHRPRDPQAELILNALGRALFGLCWRRLEASAPHNGVRVNAPPWLTRTFQRLSREPGATVHDLAETAQLSPAQFRRLFHEWVGTAPQTYLTRHRLEEARRLLLTTDLRVNDIAGRIGFDSVSYFTRLFKRHVGVSPARFRSQSLVS